MLSRALRGGALRGRRVGLVLRGRRVGLVLVGVAVAVGVGGVGPPSADEAGAGPYFGLMCSDVTDAHFDQLGDTITCFLSLGGHAPGGTSTPGGCVSRARTGPTPAARARRGAPGSTGTLLHARAGTAGTRAVRCGPATWASAGRRVRL